MKTFDEWLKLQEAKKEICDEVCDKTGQPKKECDCKDGKCDKKDKKDKKEDD